MNRDHFFLAIALTTLSSLMGCEPVEPVEPPNSTLPEEPSKEADFMLRKKDGTQSRKTQSYRRTNFDGRIALFDDGSVAKGIRLLSPERLEDRGVAELYGTNAFMGFEASSLHSAPASQNPEILHQAICDPPRNLADFPPGSNHAHPNRLNNNYTCDDRGAPHSGSGQAYDCYEFTVVTNVRTNGRLHRFWSAEVRVRTKNLKSTGSPNSRIESIEYLSAPKAGAFTSDRNDGANPGGIFEQVITADGRLVIYHGNEHGLKYVMNNTNDPSRICDASRWTTPKNLSEIHTDNAAKAYGLAAYPFRDSKNNVISPGDTLRGTYPWIDRDGDNLIFAQAAGTLYYADSSRPGNPVASRYEVAGAPFCSDEPCYNPPANQDQILSTNDGNRRIGGTLMGLWSHGKMIMLDGQLSPLNFAFNVNQGQRHSRELFLYNEQSEPTFVDVGIITDINSSENQYNYRKELRPKTPRDVVWTVIQTSGQDELAFDDYLHPKALIVSNMAPSANNMTHRLDDGFEYTYEEYYVPNNDYLLGKGFNKNPLVANNATALSLNTVSTHRALSADEAMLEIPTYGTVLGGARAEPVAAGGYQGRGIWLDGVNDRIEYEIPHQSTPQQQALLANSTWVASLMFDPRRVNGDQTLMAFPNGARLVLSGNRTLSIRKPGEADLNALLPTELVVRPRKWHHVALQFGQSGRKAGIELYYNGYFLKRFSQANRLALVPGKMKIGYEIENFKGWVDEFKVIAGEHDPELVCNYAHGTITRTVGAVPDRYDNLAELYPENGHTLVSEYAFPDDTERSDKYICETVEVEADFEDRFCLGYTNRSGDMKKDTACMRDRILGVHKDKLIAGEPRPNFRDNAFCLSCHSDQNFFSKLKVTGTLNKGIVPMEDDPRRQPLQPFPNAFGIVNRAMFPMMVQSLIYAPEEGIRIDPILQAVE